MPYSRSSDARRLTHRCAAEVFLLASLVLMGGCAREPLPAELPATGLPPDAPLFADDFAAPGAPNWEPLLGQWELQKQDGLDEYVPMPRQYGLSVAGNGMWTDYRMQARVNIVNDRSGPVGLAARVHGPHYYYEFVLGRDPNGVQSWFIRQQRNHSWVTLASGPYNFEYNVDYTLRFDVSGGKFEGAVSRDGRTFVRLGSATALGDSGDWALGRIGLITYGGSARFDDVSVVELTETSSQALTSQAAPWGPLVTLRDDTTTFANRPAGGWYVTPIHVTLLASSGQVLVTGFGRKASADCTGANQRQVGESWLLDPASVDVPPAGNNLLIAPLNEQNLDPVHEVAYCAGHSALADGRIFYSGGTRYSNTLPDSSIELGVAYSRVFDPATSTFTRIAANMKGGQAATPGMKWYPTNLAMPDGRVLMFGGFHWLAGGTGTDKNLSLELFDPKIWDANPNADPYTVLTQHSEGQAETPPTRGYTNLMLLPKPVPALNANGWARSVAAFGGAGRVFLFNHEPGPTGTQRLFARPNALVGNPSTTEKGEGANGLVLPDGRLMFTNGGHDGVGAARAYFYDPYADAWTFVDLGISRLFGDATFLADGTILLLNGYTSEPGNINDVVNPIGAQPPRQAQIINPYNNPPTVTTLPAWPEPTGRGYHAVSLLLKDGRVLVGGGKDTNHNTGCEKNELRIFEPPYISNGPRPTIQMAAGQTMTVGAAAMNIAFTGTVRATRGVSLLRPGSLTHSFDQGQRYIPLSYTSAGPGLLSVTPPSDLNVAPPGDYIMHFISDVGTPSQGLHVKVAAPPTCVYAVDGNASSYIEAEGRSRQAGSFVNTLDAAASGGSYQTVTEGSGSFFNFPDEGRVMWFDVQVTNGGTFTPWFRMRGDDDGSDTFWVSLDGGPDVKLSAVLGGGFTWVKHTSTLSIPAGPHTLKIKVREDGARIDKLLLTKNASLTPTGIANPTLVCNGPPAGPDNIAPPAPTALTAMAGNGQVSLSWMAASGATSYTVKMGTSNGGPYTTFTQSGITGTSYTKTGLANGTTVYFVVTASNAFGESPNSNQASATPIALAPISNMVVYDNLPAGCVSPNCSKDKWSIQTNFQVGNLAFGDRTYTVDAIPAGGAVLLSKTWIRPAAESKKYTMSPLVSFTVGGTFVYLLVDNRQNSGVKPPFLDATWTDQGYDVTVREGPAITYPYSVWRKSVTSGSTVTLPGVGMISPPYLTVVQ